MYSKTKSADAAVLRRLVGFYQKKDFLFYQLE